MGKAFSVIDVTRKTKVDNMQKTRLDDILLECASEGKTYADWQKHRYPIKVNPEWRRRGY